MKRTTTNIDKGLEWIQSAATHGYNMFFRFVNGKNGYSAWMSPYHALRETRKNEKTPYNTLRIEWESYDENLIKKLPKKFGVLK